MSLLPSKRQIEVLCEDKSTVAVLAQLLGASLRERGLDFPVAIHPHRGKAYLPADLKARPKKEAAGLLDLLPAKLRAYRSLSNWQDIVLVLVLDSDNEERDLIYQKLEYVLRSEAPGLRFVIGIATEETEAWFLGDEAAVLAAYPQANRQRLAAYQPDSICGTWEQLALIIEGESKGRELIALGYPAVGAYKSRWAAQISPHLRWQRNRSPSLQQFMQLFNSYTSPPPDSESGEGG